MTYREACQDFEKRWRIAYEAIRCLCRSHPAHDNLAAVTAKLWIINGTYGAQLARALISGGEDVQRLQSFAEFLCGQHARVDIILNGIADMNEPLTPEKLRRIVAAHGQLVNLIARQLNDKKKATSFSSKYMHFHNPLVPIYDSLAVKALAHPHLFRRKREDCGLEGETADENYRKFACRFWKAYKNLCERGENPEVKLVDWWLVSGGSNPLVLNHTTTAHLWITFRRHAVIGSSSNQDRGAGA